MKMGCDRNVMRWDIHHALISQRIDALEERIRHLDPAEEREAPLREELARLRRQLELLGPSPNGKMG
jgi:hypothetical protein